MNLPPWSELWPLVLPELVLLGGACAVLLADAFSVRRHAPWLGHLALITVLAAAAAVAVTPPGATAFGGQFLLDGAARLAKPALLLFTAAVFLYARRAAARAPGLGGAYWALCLLATLGLCVLCSAGHVLVLYLALEVYGVSAYALVALRRGSVAAAEAAMKFFVLGALASALLLYGLSLWYGASGGLYLTAFAAGAATPDGLGLQHLGLALIVAGVAFKLGLAPFHWWLPDAYQGAPAPVTAFLAGAPKVAALLLALRLLVEGGGGFAADALRLLVALAVIALAVGNLLALWQDDLKRMLGYSAVAQLGYAALALAAGAPAAALFYVLVYALATLGALAVLLAVSRHGREAAALDAWAGLAASRPGAAAAMSLCLLSLAGLPPLAGFHGKWWVIQALLERGWTGLAVYALVLSAIGAYYPLKVVARMVFDPPAAAAAPAARDRPASWLAAANAAGVLALGVWPGGLLEACLAAF